MATYLGTHGSRIQTYTTDPDNPNKGEVWYNATANTLKFQFTSTAGSWATGGNLNTARNGLAAVGNASNSLAFAGYDNSGYTNKTESYNGSAWTEVNDLNTTRYGPFRTGPDNTSALCASGFVSPSTNTANVEQWNGSNWTEVNNVNTSRQRGGSANGPLTSGLIFGGYDYSPNYTNKTESWNGTNWTEVNDLNSARYNMAGAGASNTSALCFGGSGPNDETELWNGTNWTEVNDLNNARSGNSGSGIATAALSFGGELPSPQTYNTEQWNGTNWTEVNDLNVYSVNGAGSGTTTNSILAGGSIVGASPENQATTQEWTAPSTSVKTISTD